LQCAWTWFFSSLSWFLYGWWPVIGIKKYIGKSVCKYLYMNYKALSQQCPEERQLMGCLEPEMLQQKLFNFKHMFCLYNKWSWTIWLASYSRNNEQRAEKRLSAASIRGSDSSIWHEHSEMWTVCWIALNKPRLFRTSCCH